MSMAVTTGGCEREGRGGEVVVDPLAPRSQRDIEVVVV